MKEYKLITIGINDPRDKLEQLMTEMSADKWEVICIDNMSIPRSATMSRDISGRSRNEIKSR